MTRVLDYRQPLVVAFDCDSGGLGRSLALKAIVRPDVVVEYLVALEYGRLLDSIPETIRTILSEYLSKT
jgi:hypothetical protein